MLDDPFPFRFPYRRERGVFSPIVSLQLFHNQARTAVDAYVDSGSMFSIFDEAIAEELGIDFGGRQEIPIIGLNGARIPIRLRTVGIRLGRYHLHAIVGFSNQLRVGFNLLGRHTIFDQLQFCFNDRDHELSVSRL
jgi:aspartyl protease